MSRISRGNGFTVYGLFDPRDKDRTMRYFGRTEQAVRKRVCDHEAETRFFDSEVNRKRYHRETSPAPLKNAWIQSLLDAGQSVGYAIIATGLDHAAAKALETTLTNSVDNTVNWDMTPAQRAARAASAATVVSRTVKERAKNGYPRPELSCFAPENKAHRAKLIKAGNGPAMARVRDARIAAQAKLFEDIKAGRQCVMKKNGTINVYRTLKQHKIKPADWQRWSLNNT